MTISKSSVAQIQDKENKIENKQQSNVLNDDYQVSENALDIAIAEKDITTIRLGLKSKFLKHQIKVTNALMEMGDMSSIPSFLRILCQEDSARLSVNLEGMIEREDLHRAIILALETLIKIDFNILDSYEKKNFSSGNYVPKEVVQRVIETTVCWWESYKQKRCIT